MAFVTQIQFRVTKLVYSILYRPNQLKLRQLDTLVRAIEFQYCANMESLDDITAFGVKPLEEYLLNDCD